MAQNNLNLENKTDKDYKSEDTDIYNMSYIMEAKPDGENYLLLLITPS